MGLILLRCFQAIGAGSSMVLGPAIISDLYPIEKRGKAYGKFVFGLIMGPTIAPTIGGFLAMSDISWRASFWFCAGLGGLLTILTILWIPETYRKHSKFDIILPTTPVEKCYNDKGLNSIHSTNNNEDQNKNNYLQQVQKEDTAEKRFNPMLPLFLLRYPHVLLSSLACAIAFGVQISTDVILPNLFQEKYGFNALEIGLAYLSGGIGNISSAILHGIISDKLLLKSRSKRVGGKHKIEDRFTFNLWPSCMILIPVGSLLFGWSIKNELNYWIPMSGYFISCFGTTQVLAIVSTYLTDSIPDHAASVAAGTVFVRETITCLLSLLSVKWMDSIGPGYLTVVLSGLIWISFGLLIILKIYGQRFRHHSGLKQLEE
ncbi:major facilitator superfamily domain-containing protein [Circinella umbellata]|nr:major facilitator superfamily domain-containing protein [Circinella umbellata]